MKILKNCIFCKIVNNELPSAKIWENSKFLAILDKNPNVKGMTLVLTKKHYSSYIFDMKKSMYQEFLLAAKKVSKILEIGLKVKRVAMVIEGLGINHAHIKLYPLHGLKKKFEEKTSKKRIYFKKYIGYISTQLGPEKSIQELQKIASEIIKNYKKYLKIRKK